LSIRTLCSDGKQFRIADEEGVNTQIQKAAAEYKLNGTVLPIRSVGVQGDQRSYQHPALVYGADASWNDFGALSVRLTNTITGVNRVVCAIGGKIIPAKMRVTEGHITFARLNVLRKADAVVDQFVRDNGLYDSIWQFPVIILPLTFGAGETIVLRPIESQEAMTVNFYPMDHALLAKLAEQIMAIDGIGAVLYDITNKPPATIEWE
jgi:GMP synthase (glutamine-hydrolysing)